MSVSTQRHNLVRLVVAQLLAEVKALREQLSAK